MNEVPELTATGVEGTQAVGTSLVPATIAPPMQAANVPDAIEGLLATHSRNLGGDVAARLLAASMRESSNQLAAAHEQIAELGAESKANNALIGDLRVRNAELTATLKQMNTTNRIKNAAIFVGTALLGVAVDFFKSNITGYASLFALLGIGLFVFVLLPINEGKRR